jgi:uncharacterized protein
MTLSLGLLLIGILALSYLSTTSIFNQQQDRALAQQSVQTIKYTNLVIDLGNGLKTNATLTYPAVGKGPFPRVLLIQGASPARPFPEVAPYLSERGFAVLQYDKRGTNGVNHTIIDTNIWGNVTVNNLIHDAEKALNVLVQQPEVDPKRVSIVGHSEGTVITPRVAIDNSTIVKNIILMSPAAQNVAKDIFYYQAVNLPFRYATQVLDKNHTGFISIQQIAKDPQPFIRMLPLYAVLTNNTKVILPALGKEFGNSGNVSINKQLKPLLIKSYENLTALNSSKCNNIVGCPEWYRSHLMLIPNLSIIGNVSKSIGVLLLSGENDSAIPVQQAFLLQQRLTDVNHPDHQIIVYPDLGHNFVPSNQWISSTGQIPEYVLQDLFEWLSSPSRQK